MWKRNNVAQQFLLPDYISLTGLIIGWGSVLLLIQNKPNFAVIVAMIAFSADILDGYIARRLQVNPAKGRYIDSMCDLIIYIIFSATLYFLYLSPHSIIGALVSIGIVLLGAAHPVLF